MQTSSDALEMVSEGEKRHPVLGQTLMPFGQPLKSRELERAPGDHISSSCLWLSRWLPKLVSRHRMTGRSCSSEVPWTFVSIG